MGIQELLPQPSWAFLGAWLPAGAGGSMLGDLWALRDFGSTEASGETRDAVGGTWSQGGAGSQ